VSDDTWNKCKDLTSLVVQTEGRRHFQDVFGSKMNNKHMNSRRPCANGPANRGSNT